MKIAQILHHGVLTVVVQGEGGLLNLPETAKRLGVNFNYRSLEAMLFTWQRARAQVEEIVERSGVRGDGVWINEGFTWLPPVRRARTFRDFYAFEEHVRNVRKLRGLEVDPNWYKTPLFYYSHPGNFVSHNAVVSFPSDSQKWDYELEVAAILGRGGRNLQPDEAESLIAGYTLLNDWSARDLQRVEMTAGLGPARSKEFATSLGPFLVTPDELEDRRSGKGFDLYMRATINGEVTSQGNWASIHFSFGEMIAQASRCCSLYAGEVIGSGTVGTGCLLERGWEHNLWLKVGDNVELEVERLGRLGNRVGPPF